MASKVKPAVKAAEPVVVAPKDTKRVEAGKKGAPQAQVTRSAKAVEAAKPFKASIAFNAPAAAVSAAITSIKSRGAKLDNDIHSAALACLFHADKHGDITLMNKLLLALPNSARRNALAQWAVHFGKFMPNEDKKSMETAPLAFDKASSTDIEGATAKPFWDFKNVKEGTTEWDFGNYVDSVMKTLARHATTSPEAKMMFDSIQAARQAILAKPPAAPAEKVEVPTFVPGVTAERRATAH